MDKIIELYLNNGKLIFNVDIDNINTIFIGFGFKDFRKLVDLLGENKIIINAIEIFKDEKYTFPDFNYYIGNDLKDNYDKVNDYLKSIKFDKKYLFSIRFDDDFLIKGINMKLKEKYKFRPTKEEKEQRIKNGWEFIDE